MTSGKQDAGAQGIKTVKTESDLLDYLDSIIQSFAEAVGFFIFPTVLYVSALVADGTTAERTSSTSEGAYVLIHSVNSSD